MLIQSPSAAIGLTGLAAASSLVFSPASATAQGLPPGYNFPPSMVSSAPEEPCFRPEMVSSGAVEKLNATIGHPNGAPGRTENISDPAPIDRVQLASIDIRLPAYGDASFACHVTLNIVGGGVETGIMSIWDPGQYAPLQFSWISDSAIAAQRARVDKLRTAKNLFVTPDLSTPEIQVCVGRKTALGADEQFPGQLWAACSAEAGNSETRSGHHQ